MRLLPLPPKLGHVRRMRAVPPGARDHRALARDSETVRRRRGGQVDVVEPVAPARVAVDAACRCVSEMPICQALWKADDAISTPRFTRLALVHDEPLERLHARPRLPPTDPRAPRSRPARQAPACAAPRCRAPSQAAGKSAALYRHSLVHILDSPRLALRAAPPMARRPLARRASGRAGWSFHMASRGCSRRRRRTGPCPAAAPVLMSGPWPPHQLRGRAFGRQNAARSPVDACPTMTTLSAAALSVPHVLYTTVTSRRTKGDPTRARSSPCGSARRRSSC